MIIHFVVYPVYYQMTSLGNFSLGREPFSFYLSRPYIMQAFFFTVAAADGPRAFRDPRVYADSYGRQDEATVCTDDGAGDIWSISLPLRFL
jgi:hypothetical protein